MRRALELQDALHADYARALADAWPAPPARRRRTRASEEEEEEEEENAPSPHRDGACSDDDSEESSDETCGSEVERLEERKEERTSLAQPSWSYDPTDFFRVQGAASDHKGIDWAILRVTV